MNFLEALEKRKAGGTIPVIPDIKCFSPKEGELMRGRDPLAYALSMERAGAPVLSVVTEEKEFHGSMELLRRICRAVNVPVLRKDFVQDVGDLEETLEAGASAILLMYSCLGREKLELLYRQCLALGLVPFVETHSQEELSWAAELGAPLIGINNRNILALERDDGDVSHAESLLPGAPEGALLVVESGLMSAGDVRKAARAGADAALVGTALLLAPDPEAMLWAMMRPCGLKICGVMDREGVDMCAEAQADLVGFVTEYPVSVPWNLQREEAKTLIGYLKERAVSPLNCGGTSPKSCIVTGGSPEKVIALTRELEPDYVQLHFRENVEELREIAEALHGLGIRVIRSMPSEDALRIEMFGSADTGTIFKKIQGAGADAGLLDSRDAGNAASGGGSILAGEAPERREGLALVIGGGITEENGWEAYERFRPDLIDVMTGVESSPGRKDKALLSGLTAALAGQRRGKAERKEA